MGISPLLPWITISASLIGTVTRNGIDLSYKVGVLSIAFSIIGVMLILFYKNKNRTGVVLVCMGGLMIVESLSSFVQIQEQLREFSSTLPLGSVGIGIYSLGIGALLTIIGGILLLRMEPSIKIERSQKIDLIVTAICILIIIYFIYFSP